MTLEIVIMLFLLVGILVAFALERLPTELTAMSAFALLLVLGFLPADRALSVFSNAGPIAVAGLFILSAALERGGAIEGIALGVNRIPKLTLRVFLPFLILVVALISAFINNTPVVVVFLPVVMGLAQKIGVAPSKLLIPLSYASIFGGTCTLVGTSTNIIVSSVAEQAGMAPIGMFELASVGIPILVIGTVYLVLLGPKLLPDRATVTSILTEEERREYIVEAFVTEHSPLEGKSVAETLAKQKGRFRVLEIMRHGVKVPGVILNIVLHAGDRLLLALSPKALSSAQQTEGIDLFGGFGDGLAQISTSEGIIVEGVLGPDSDLVGKSIAQINFRQRYRLAPMAVHRRGQNILGDFDNVRLDYGDTLLMLGTQEALDNLRGNEDILIINKPPVILDNKKKKKLFITLGVIASVITTATLGILPIAQAAIIGCVVILLFRCLTTRQAYESVHWPIIFLIFAMLGFGIAMEETGTSRWLADQLVALIALAVPPNLQPLALLAGLYLITTLLTEILSNNAAAILISSLAISIAESMGLDARPFIVAIAIAASASFATPIGYQTNTYVYGVGGYRFVDFMKIGIPLNLLSFVSAVVIIPMFWDF